MEIWHRVSFGHNDHVKQIIENLSIKYELSPLPGGGYVLHLDISESDVHWPEIATLVQRTMALDLVHTVFTPEEVLEAKWSRLVVLFERGYPQPENGWKQLTYENGCRKCGAGYHQKAPFRLKKEPKMSKYSFLSLYWTSTVFCIPEVVEGLRSSQIGGYEERDAILHKTDQPSQIVTQLVFPVVAEPGLAQEDKIQPDTCPECGITKYRHHRRGYMHLRQDALQFDTDIQLTNEWFGSDSAMGYREILVPNCAARLILDKGWRGVALKPIKLV